MAVRILHEDEYGNRAVELSSSVGEAWCSSAPAFGQVVAVFERDGEVSIHKMETGSETLSLRLSAEEVERFIEAHQAYKQDQVTQLDDLPF